ncbi:hypothetical protein DY000_02049773 [Brassica cretica]|uniref:Uncharacterized protein n=1 Tax=Brassica cretica TaxID=69181 RepID=A0ABQ7F6Z1_BRACR|nr:hypothetical protein DY000_02049773 [Brassica cretica]
MSTADSPDLPSSPMRNGTSQGEAHGSDQGARVRVMDRRINLLRDRLGRLKAIGTTRGRENEEVHSEDKENQDVLEGNINHKEGELVSSVKDTEEKVEDTELEVNQKGEVIKWRIV